MRICTRIGLWREWTGDVIEMIEIVEKHDCLSIDEYIGADFVEFNRDNYSSRFIFVYEADQRKLLLWFKNNRPELWREIFCEDYPEHV